MVSEIIFTVAHCEALQTTNSLYLASTLSQLQQNPQAEQSSGVLKEPVLQEYASGLLMHVVKLLCVYVHIIEDRDPEMKEKVWILEYCLYVCVTRLASLLICRGCPCLLFHQERDQVTYLLRESKSLRF